MNDDNLDDTQEHTDVKSLRQAASEGAAAKAELDRVKRELAFAKAGVDTDSKLGKLLYAAYDGDLTADAIKAAATDIGMFQTAPAPQDTPAATLTATEKLVLDAQRQIAPGAQSAHTPPAKSPYVEAGELLTEHIARGGKREDAVAHAITHLLDAAAKGDSRVAVQ